MLGVLGAIGSQPLGFHFRARRPKEVIFLCKATVVEQRLELFDTILLTTRCKCSCVWCYYV
jgi:hypothetical protein